MSISKAGGLVNAKEEEENILFPNSRINFLRNGLKTIRKILGTINICLNILEPLLKCSYFTTSMLLKMAYGILTHRFYHFPLHLSNSKTIGKIHRKS